MARKRQEEVDHRQVLAVWKGLKQGVSGGCVEDVGKASTVFNSETGDLCAVTHDVSEHERVLQDELLEVGRYGGLEELDVLGEQVTSSHEK